VTTLAFLGAAGTVTGSKFVVEHVAQKGMVGCGLLQALAPATLGALPLTHADVNHSGYRPLLVNKGFAGLVWASPATVALAAGPDRLFGCGLEASA